MGGTTIHNSRASRPEWSGAVIIFSRTDCVRADPMNEYFRYERERKRSAKGTVSIRLRFSRKLNHPFAETRYIILFSDLCIIFFR